MTNAVTTVETVKTAQILTDTDVFMITAVEHVLAVNEMGFRQTPVSEGGSRVFQMQQNDYFGWTVTAAGSEDRYHKSYGSRC